MLPDHQIFTMEDGVFILREATVNAVGRFAQPGVGLYHKSGWVGFDISNGISPDERYVRVATGRDYRDAAPVTGISFGTTSTVLEVDVAVEQQQVQQ